MLRRAGLSLLGLLFLCHCSAQNKRMDSLALHGDVSDYDALFSELDALLDSLVSPRSYAIANLTVGQSFLSYENKSGQIEGRQRFTYTPSVGYYHYNGLGLTLGAVAVNDGEKLNPYQFSATASYDYQQNKALVTGVSFTHFITKKDLSFYTSPLQNELYGYFTYRKLWFRPSIGISYGWGSRESFAEVEDKKQKIILAQRGFTRISTTERINDLNLTLSARHDFYFLKALGSSYVRLTPQLAFISGSQQFGFNQTSNSYVTMRRTGRNVLYNAENLTFDNNFYFQPISMTGFLKAEYAKGKFYVQPQLLLDYYFPASDNRFTTAFLVSAGLVL